MFIDKEKIQINGFLGLAYLRYHNNIYHQMMKKNDKENIYILIQKTHKLKLNIFTAYYLKSQFLNLSMISTEEDLIKDWHKIEDYFHVNGHLLKIIKDSIELKNYPEVLYDYSIKNKLIISYCYFELTKSIQEIEKVTENDIIQIANFYSGGFPPLILVENNSYHFPLRSGIPLGIVEIHPQKQTLEIPLNSKIFLHTSIDENPNDLRELHYNLLQDELNNIPRDILLFEYHFIKYEK
jgi:hypothetical protein